MRPSEDRQTTTVRLTVPEAAEMLNTTPDAVRSRLRRGKLHKERAEDGTVLVVLDLEDRDGQDGQPTVEDGQVTVEPTTDYINELKSENELLRAQLEAWQEESRRKDVLLMNLSEGLKALTTGSSSETSSEPRGWPMPPANEQGNGETPQQQEPRPSWWRRVFLGE